MLALLIMSIAKFKFHIFVCVNERPAGHPRGCCKEKNADALIPALKAELNRLELRSVVRAQRASCLDACEFGPTLVIYPQGIWYGKVELSDIPEIAESLLSGKPVDRLLIPGK